ncbi:L-lactate transporter [subsurface metagenome]
MDSDPASFDPPRKQGVFYGWIVVAAAFLITAITCGAFYSYGVFFMPVLTEFGSTRGLISGVSSVAGFTYAATIPLAGLLADRYGFRLIMAITAGLLGLGFLLSSQVQAVWQLYLFAGLFTGCGSSIAIALPLSMVSQWFTRRQGLALGIASAGIGFGTALVPVLAACLISDYGWRVAYAIVGSLVCLICIPLSLITMRKPQDSYVQAYEGEKTTGADAHRQGDGNPGSSLLEAVRTAPFWFLFAVYALCILGLAAIMIHVVPYALDMGLPAVTAAGLLTVIGVCSIIGRLASGAASDKVGTKPVLAACLAAQGIMMLWLMNAGDLWSLYLFAVFFGISYGGCIPLIPKMTSQLFGSRSIGAIFGGISVADGVGFMIGPFLAGYVFDITGSYHISFLGFGAGVLAAVILSLFLRPPRKPGFAS